MYISTETRKFIKEHQSDDIRMLALQAGKYPGVDMRAAIDQISGRRTAAEKIPSLHINDNIIYPPHLPLEQCSSEAAALFKASLLKGNSFVDLTGGFGIDCAFISENFRKVTYVERQRELCEIAQHNFSALGLNHIIVRNEDSIDHLNKMEPVDCIYIDPARRNKHGGKAFMISGCEPNVEEVEGVLLLKAKKIMIKLSPMLDLTLALQSLRHTGEVYVVSIQNECKELLLTLEENIPGNIPVHCVNITNKGTRTYTFTKEEESRSVCGFSESVRTYLYEPGSSILKAGAFRSISGKYNISKLHPNSHLYTSDELIHEFPGRIFRVLNYSSPKDRKLVAGIKKANISTRNFPVTAGQLREKLKLDDGGYIYIFGTTLYNNKRVLIKGEKIS